MKEEPLRVTISHSEAIVCFWWHQSYGGKMVTAGEEKLLLIRGLL